MTPTHQPTDNNIDTSPMNDQFIDQPTEQSSNAADSSTEHQPKPKKMNRALRLTLRIILILLAVVLGLLLIILGVVNLVLTNDRLQPIAHTYIHEYLDADVAIGNIEGTFFSSFPYLGVRVDSVTIVTNAFQHAPAMLTDTVPPIVDSLRMRRDTLLRLDRAVVGLDVMQFVRGDSDITIGLVALRGLKARLVTDSLGRCGWDIVRPTPPDTAPSEPINLKFKRIRLENTRISYFSFPDQMWGFVDSLNLKVKGDVGLDALDADVELNHKRMSFGISKNPYLRKMPLDLNGHVNMDINTGVYNLSDMAVKFIGTDINITGTLHPDSTGMDVDIAYNIDSPDAKNLFDAIPKSVISTPVDVEDGSIMLQGSVRGRLSDTEVPVIEGTAKVLNVKAQYKGQPEKIEDFTADFNMYIDKALPDSSYVNLDIFHFKGGKSEVSAVVRVTQLLARAMMNAEVNAHVDLANMKRVIPLDNINMGGVVDANVKAQLALEDVLNQNYGRVKADGQVVIDSLYLKTKNEKDTTNFFNFLIDASIDMKTDEIIKVNSTLNRLTIKTNEMRLGVRKGEFVAYSKFVEDTAQIIPLFGKLNLQRVNFRMDSIRVRLRNLETKDFVAPQKENKKKLVSKHNMTVDTIMASALGNKIFATQFHVNAGLRANADTTWHTTAKVDYKTANAVTPYYMLPIRTSDFRFSMSNDSLALENVTLQAGQSRISLSACIQNLFHAIKKREPISLHFNADADTVNCNEILAGIVNDSTAVTEAIASEQTDDDTVDSTLVNAVDTVDLRNQRMPTNMIFIPKKMKVSVGLKAKTVIWDKLTLNNVSTNMVTNNGAVHMTNLLFKLDGDGRVITTLAYKAWPLTGKARANIFSRWERADIKVLTSSLGLDSILPVLGPMSGKLDCYLAAEVELDSLMNPVLPTARASIHLGGKDLVVMDGEQFRKIAKVLMFKNKEHNAIDTLSLNVLLDSGHVQVLPFELSMDRYRMAVAGEQDLDMNINYHVSILKSPLPFKAGATISGPIEDFDVDITTAKLKKKVTPELLAKNDSISLLMRMVIMRNSYLLSGLPVPKQISSIPGLDQADSSPFALSIEADEADESELREVERLRRQQMGLQADSLSTVSPDSATHNPTPAAPDSAAAESAVETASTITTTQSDQSDSAKVTP